MTYIPIIVGSPRKMGNTKILAEAAAEGLIHQGAEVEIFMLNEMEFSGCQACYGCKQDGHSSCVRNDEMQRIYAAIDRADGIIVASPIYFGGVTGQTKIWLDRLFPYITFTLGSNLKPGLPVACIYTQNQPDPSLFTSAADSFEYMLHLIGFRVKGRLVAPDLDAGRKQMATDKPHLMAEAARLGENLFA